MEFDIASSTETFISSVTTELNENFGLVLVFAGSIMVWMILKKWIFGGTSRI